MCANFPFSSMCSTSDFPVKICSFLLTQIERLFALFMFFLITIPFLLFLQPPLGSLLPCLHFNSKPCWSFPFSSGAESLTFVSLPPWMARERRKRKKKQTEIASTPAKSCIKRPKCYGIRNKIKHKRALPNLPWNAGNLEVFSAVKEQISNLNVSGGVGAHILLCRWDRCVPSPLQAQLMPWGLLRTEAGQC